MGHSEAENEWIILLDADERVSIELKNEITKILEIDSDYDAFWIKDKIILWVKVRFSGWQGDKVIRLFKRDTCKYEDKNVHAEIICAGKVGVLNEKVDSFYLQGRCSLSREVGSLFNLECKRPLQ